MIPTTITQDDVAAHSELLAALDAADEELRDFTDRLRRKEDAARVAALRRATDALCGVRRQVRETMQ